MKSYIGQIARVIVAAVGMYVAVCLVLSILLCLGVTAVRECRAGVIVAEVCVGTVQVDEEGQNYGTIDGQHYMAYPDRFQAGDKVLTICIYNPCNNYIDDIANRSDVLLDRK